MSRVAASSRSERTIRGPTPRRHAGQRGVQRLALEGDPQHAALALDDDERADRGLERGVDGVGEALLHGGGGQAVEELLGQGGHAVTLSRRVRTAVDTRWRAASGECSSAAAMRS